MFNSQNGGYSLSDIAAVTDGSRGGFGFGDSNGWWVILLFLFAFGGWGNGGFFGNNGAGGVTNDVGYSFDIHDINDGLRDVSSGMSNGFYNLNTGLLNGFANTNAQICNSGFETLQAINANTLAGLQNTNALTAQLAAHSADEQLCCCQTQNLINTNFANLNYNLATEACANRTALQSAERDIMEQANNNTRQILDFLVQDRITALTTENQALRTQISQEKQNEYLLDQLRPTAQPAYVVANPYTGTILPAAYTYGCNCGGATSIFG